MLLTEFIYFDKKNPEMDEVERYDIDRDVDVLKSSDLRKSRLTLRMINDLRKAGETREKEKRDDLALVRKMYAPPPAAPGVAPSPMI